MDGLAQGSLPSIVEDDDEIGEGRRGMHRLDGDGADSDADGEGDGISMAFAGNGAVARLGRGDINTGEDSSDLSASGDAMHRGIIPGRPALGSLGGSMELMSSMEEGSGAGFGRESTDESGAIGRDGPGDDRPSPVARRDSKSPRPRGDAGRLAAARRRERTGPADRPKTTMTRGAKSVGRGLRAGSRGQSPSGGRVGRQKRARGAGGALRKPAASRPRALSPAAREAQLRRAASAQDRTSSGGRVAGLRAGGVGRQATGKAFAGSPPKPRQRSGPKPGDGASAGTKGDGGGGRGKGRAGSPLATATHANGSKTVGRVAANGNRDKKQATVRAIRAQGATTGRGDRPGAEGFVVEGDAGPMPMHRRDAVDGEKTQAKSSSSSSSRDTSDGKWTKEQGSKPLAAGATGVQPDGSPLQRRGGTGGPAGNPPAASLSLPLDSRDGSRMLDAAASKRGDRTSMHRYQALSPRKSPITAGEAITPPRGEPGLSSFADSQAGGSGSLRLPKQEASPLPGSRRLAPLPLRDDPLDRTGGSLAMSIATELSGAGDTGAASSPADGGQASNPFALADANGLGRAGIAQQGVSVRLGTGILGGTGRTIGTVLSVDDDRDPDELANVTPGGSIVLGRKQSDGGSSADGPALEVASDKGSDSDDEDEYEDDFSDGSDSVLSYGATPEASAARGLAAGSRGSAGSLHAHEDEQSSGSGRGMEDAEDGPVSGRSPRSGAQQHHGQGAGGDEGAASDGTSPRHRVLEPQDSWLRWVHHEARRIAAAGSGSLDHVSCLEHGHSATITSVSCGPRYAATGSMDGLAIVWPGPRSSEGRPGSAMHLGSGRAQDRDGSEPLGGAQSMQPLARLFHRLEQPHSSSATSPGGPSRPVRSSQVDKSSRSAAPIAVTSVHVSRSAVEGKLALLTGDEDGVVRVWEATPGDLASGRKPPSPSGAGRSAEGGDADEAGGSGPFELQQAMQGHKGAIRCLASAVRTTARRYSTLGGAGAADATEGSNATPPSLQPQKQQVLVVVSGSTDQTIKVWEPMRRRPLVRTLRGHRGAVTALAMTPEGMLLSSAADRTVRCWSLSSGRQVMVLADHLAAVTCIAVAPDWLRRAQAVRLLASHKADAQSGSGT